MRMILNNVSLSVRVFLIFIIIFTFSQICFAQKSLVFQKKSNGKEISVPLPTSSSFLTLDHNWQEGTISELKDSTIMWSYHFHDSLKFYEIVKNKSFSKKERRMKTDSLFKADSVIVTTHLRDIQKMRFKVKEIQPTTYKKRMWTLVAISQASGVVVLVAVLLKAVPLAQVAIPIYSITFGAAILSVKKTIRFSKWKIKA